MLGAIIGDIAGSCFEWHNYKSKDFEFLTYKYGMFFSLKAFISFENQKSHANSRAQ